MLPRSADAPALDRGPPIWADSFKMQSRSQAFPITGRRTFTMSSVPNAGGHYPQRFALAAFPDGGVVLDLETGAFFRVNAAASQVFAWLIAGASANEAASRLVSSFGI